jgi:para-nitrobenzyl esterase
LGIADGPDVLAKLRAKSPKEILQVSGHDPAVNFMAGGTIDGWVLTEQPAIALTEGHLARVPVITGSTADEGTVTVEDDFRVEPTLANYKAYMKQEFVNDAEEFLRLYSAATDAEVHDAFAHFDTDYCCGFPVHRFAQNAAQNGQKTWFYYFTYAGHSERLQELGAYHGIENKFLTGWFRPARWGEPNDEDRKLGEIMLGYSANFAKTGDPNGPALPPWPTYDPKTDQTLEIGHEIRLRPTPHVDRFVVFERSLNNRLAFIPRSGEQRHYTTPQASRVRP